MLDQPENRAKVQAIIDEIERAHAGFSALRGDLARVEEHRDTLLKAADAAEREAEDAREELRALVRATLGNPGKALREKQAKHRAALETAEDYRALAREADEAATALRVEMSPLANGLERLHTELRKTFPRLVLAEAIDAIAPRLKIAHDAFGIEYHHSRNEYLPGYSPERSHEENILNFLLAEIGKQLSGGLMTKVSAEVPGGIRAALRKTAGGFRPFSVIQIARLKKGLPPAIDSSFASPHERKAVPL